MSGHVFDAAIALQPAGDNLFTGATSAAYANMIGPYGGITAAQMINAVMLHPKRLGEPLSLTVNFAAALADGAFTVEARPARTNRSTQHWTLEIRQADGVVMTGTAVTAARREIWSPSSDAMPAVPPVQDVPVVSRRSRVEWLNRYEVRSVEGSLPETWDGADQEHSRTQVWVRDTPVRALDFASLTALCDVFFPRIWLRRSKFTPVGTVSMTVYFHAGDAQLKAVGTGYLMAQAQAQAFHNGYFDQSAQMWNEQGQLLATSHQIVYYKE
ncbi:acyl-CoA thioesterase [Caenimonas koreensis]|uniref:acyl-CoA thioesterase n=1 Tax=Caenimonas koreensis TaxID=367474 RepID=UPI00378474D4